MIQNFTYGKSGTQALTPLIVVTAPTGSTVTCDGIQGTEVSGTWTFPVVIGTHTIVATKGSVSNTQNVNVDQVAIFRITISYTLYIYKEGNECTALTGGWVANSSTVVDGHQASIIRNSNNITLSYTSSGRWGGGMNTVNSISTQGYSYVCLDFLWNFDYPNNGEAFLSAAGKGITLCLYSSTKYYPTGTRQTVRLSASSVSSGQASCSMRQYSSGYTGSIVIYNIWLE